MFLLSDRSIKEKSVLLQPKFLVQQGPLHTHLFGGVLSQFFACLCKAAIK